MAYQPKILILPLFKQIGFLIYRRAKKPKFPLAHAKNAGWESRKQVRSSTGLADQKESYQIVPPRMKGLWPKESQLPGFKRQLLAFENSCWFLSMQLMSCFAEKLGLIRIFSPRPTTQSNRIIKAHCACCTITPAQKKTAVRELQNLLSARNNGGPEHIPITTA